MVAEKGIRKSAPVSRWNDDLATFADSLVIHSQKPWAGQGVGELRGRERPAVQPRDLF